MAHPLLDEVVELLDVEELEVNVFRGHSPKEKRPRVFGGQVAAQSLMAAARTVPEGRRVHSLHSYFLRPGDVKAPILYLVDRIRDGKSFTTRRVVAVQHGEVIFNIAASFQVHEPGLSHSLEMPQAPDPETLPTRAERMAGFGRKLPRYAVEPRAIDMRWCDARGWKPRKGEDARAMVWMRADGKLPDDPLLHTCVLVYASDYTLTETVMRPHGIHWSDPGVMATSLDHAMWFHRDFKVDEWWLYVEDSPAAENARGLARGIIFDRSGALCCSVVQEILLRTSPPPGS